MSWDEVKKSRQIKCKSDSVLNFLHNLILFKKV